VLGEEGVDLIPKIHAATVCVNLKPSVDRWDSQWNARASFLNQADNEIVRPWKRMIS
jgi:hypothetical protein